MLMLSIILSSDLYHRWLPTSSSFTINATIGNITSDTNPKYRNIRMMAGNSGDGNSIVSNPWMTALQAASLLPVGIHGSPYRKILDFGATCWYFAQKLTDELHTAGKEVFPIGLTDTAIGGQRIEEYMVNDTTVRGRLSHFLLLAGSLFFLVWFPSFFLFCSCLILKVFWFRFFRTVYSFQVYVWASCIILPLL